jgi:hypothetical protein
MHKGIGNCNPKELYKIIEKIKPEVIFEENSFSRTIDFYRNQYLHTIETVALVPYLLNYKVEYIPVETYDVPLNYEKNTDYVNDKISNISHEYKYIFDEIVEKAKEKGFSYLNSMECSNLFVKSQEIKENIVKISNDKLLLDAYNISKSITDNRENYMINSIYAYSQKANYNNAIFITGAEHRNSMMYKIQDYERRNELKLNWHFNLAENTIYDGRT